MEKEPEQRFQSARDVGFALEALSGTSDSQTTRALPSLRKNREWIWKIASAVFFLLMLAAIAALLARSQRPSRQLEVLHMDIAYPQDVSRLQDWLGDSPSLQTARALRW